MDKKLSPKEINEQFINACKNCDIEKMHYFLTCDEVKVNINEGQYNFNDHYILWACSASKSPNALEGLTSPKLKKHAKLEPYILIVAAKADNLDVVRYL